MASQSIGVPETRVPKWPTMLSRLIYEDRGARISIMARATAQGPDTLRQTVRDQLRTNPLADRGRAIHFGTHKGEGRERRKCSH